jgi:hypothetical protein
LSQSTGSARTAKFLPDKRDANGVLQLAARANDPGCVGGVMIKILADEATSAVAKVAVVIFQAAAKGQTSYQGLMSVALDQIHTILSELT